MLFRSIEAGRSGKILSTLSKAGRAITPFTKVVAVAALIAGIAQQGSVAYNRDVTAGYCGDVSSGGEERDGCSVVRTVNYNKEEIGSYCSVIESIS